MNNHCMLFYETFGWFKKKYGHGLEFISDTEVKMTEEDVDAPCMFDDKIKISDQICDKFSITFEIKAVVYLKLHILLKIRWSQ